MKVVRCDYCGKENKTHHPDVLIKVQWIEYDKKDVEIDLCEDCGRRAYSFLKEKR